MTGDRDRGGQPGIKGRNATQKKPCRLGGEVSSLKTGLSYSPSCPKINRGSRLGSALTSSAASSLLSELSPGDPFGSRELSSFAPLPSKQSELNARTVRASRVQCDACCLHSAALTVTSALPAAAPTITRVGFGLTVRIKDASSLRSCNGSWRCATGPAVHVRGSIR
jgi:hypothetical protein